MRANEQIPLKSQLPKLTQDEADNLNSNMYMKLKLWLKTPPQKNSDPYDFIDEIYHTLKKQKIIILPKCFQKILENTSQLMLQGYQAPDTKPHEDIIREENYRLIPS